MLADAVPAMLAVARDAAAPPGERVAALAWLVEHGWGRPRRRAS